METSSKEERKRFSKMKDGDQNGTNDTSLLQGAQKDGGGDEMNSDSVQPCKSTLNLEVTDKDNGSDAKCSEFSADISSVGSVSALSDVQFFSQVNLLKRDSNFPQDPSSCTDALIHNSTSGGPVPKTEIREDVPPSNLQLDIVPPVFPKKRRRWKREIYDKNGDPESIKAQRKKRAVELKLKNLKWTLNQPGVSEEVSGKRKKKAPERFELALLSKRRSTTDEFEGDGDQLGDIPWIVQQVKLANIYILRLLHRVIFRRQGMFSEKHIRKSVVSFRGFPFDLLSTELKKRKYPLEKASPTSLTKLCELLGIKSGAKEVMIENILRFLHHPTKQEVEENVKEIMAKLQQPLKHNPNVGKVSMPMQNAHVLTVYPSSYPLNLSPDSHNVSTSSITLLSEEECIITGPWNKPQFFVEGTGIKLKYIKPIVTSLQVVTDSLIELLHRILFLNGDEKANMRRNILEFSGFRCIVGSDDYILRTKLLGVLPLDQLKFICRVLGLPTWHRSRQLLIETIMDFLAAPRLSAMKKRVAPPLPNNACPLAHPALSSATSEDEAFGEPYNDYGLFSVKHMETEEIEIVPDIHISDEEFDTGDGSQENVDENEVKLKHFQNIHYQVITTPAGKLNDLHMILFLKPCPLATVRKNILEFSRFMFDDQSPEYHCRHSLMEHMFLETLKKIASILCLSQYIVDQSRENIIQAVLRFLLKPSILFNASSMLPSPTAMLPTIKDSMESRDGIVDIKEVRRESTGSSTCSENMPVFSPGSNLEINTLPLNSSTAKKKIDGSHGAENSYDDQPQKNPENLVSKPTPVKCESEKSSTNKKSPTRSSTSVGKCRSSKKRKAAESDKATPVISPPIRQSHTTNETPTAVQNGELNEPLSLVKEKNASISTYEPRLESDEDDQPLMKFIGHPNDDQLKALVSKVMKESKLDELTMKQLIKVVFSAYPHFDLGYRKEFIKSVARQILSQMDQQRCSVSTTVFT